MLQSIAQNVFLGWLWRRAQELGSLATLLISFYLAMPPHMQAVVGAVLAGQGGGLSISAAVGLIWYIWTQWQSYRATVRPQVVTSAGEKLVMKPNSGTLIEVEQVARYAPQPKSVLERIGEVFKR